MRMPSEPEALARWLLHHAVVGDESPTVFAAAAEATHGRLRAHLSIVFGQAGFDALWARALSLAPRSVAENTSVGDGALLLGALGWSDALRGRSPDEMRSVVAAFTSFIGLLFRFVGAELGSRLLHQVWPELPLAAPSTATGDVTR